MCIAQKSLSIDAVALCSECVLSVFTASITIAAGSEPESKIMAYFCSQQRWQSLFLVNPWNIDRPNDGKDGMMK